MSCQQVQTNLSLYLYGELDFAQEEELERHLSECAFCQQAWAREKSWHATANAEHVDVPFDLLSQCRRELRTAISSSQSQRPERVSWWNWAQPLGLSATRWSMRVAIASFLVITGFSAARWMDRGGLSGLQMDESAHMGLLDASTTRIRDIQPRGDDRVRIIFDQVRPHEIIGRVDDGDVRQLLLAAAKDPVDPGIRVYSVEMLNGQDGSDIRDALLFSVRHDTNAAVRLKALDGLRRFAGDAAARETLKFVLQHDDNAGVRSEAIDVLAPANRRTEFNPDLAGTLQEIARSGRDDDYVRMRCLQILREMKASMDVY
jgi:hypothetical protein